MQVDFQQVLSQLREENRTIEASNPILSDGGAVTFTFIDLPYDSTPQDASHPDRSEFLTDKRQTADLKKQSQRYPRPRPSLPLPHTRHLQHFHERHEHYPVTH